jgi:hypothetical protein
MLSHGPANPSPLMLRAALVASRLILKHPRTLRVGERQMSFSSQSKERASLRFEMRISPSEREQLKDDADLAGIGISELVRRRALGRPVHSAIDLMMIRELRRLGGLQKHAMNTLMHHQGIAEECIATIQALRAAVERVASDDH